LPAEKLSFFNLLGKTQLIKKLFNSAITENTEKNQKNNFRHCQKALTELSCLILPFDKKIMKIEFNNLYEKN